MHSLLVLSQTFKVFLQHVTRTFTLYMLFEHPVFKFNRNLDFISNVQSKAILVKFLSIQFQRKTRLTIFQQETVKKGYKTFFKRMCDGEHCFIKSISFISRYPYCTFPILTASGQACVLKSVHFEYLLLVTLLVLKSPFRPSFFVGQSLNSQLVLGYFLLFIFKKIYDALSRWKRFTTVLGISPIVASVLPNEYQN